MLRLDARLSDALCCPVCKGPISMDAARATCTECNHDYVINRGVPILLRPDNQLFTAHHVVATEDSWTRQSGFRRFIPRTATNLVSAQNYARLQTMLLAGCQNPRVLLIGAGEGGQGLGSLIHQDMILARSDVVIAQTTDVVADAHDLPFKSATFDVVVAQAVMEHVLDPERCVHEIHRVLKEGGLVYAETPFMQQVHFGAYDFTRWTPLGHRRLFRNFSEIASGVAVGPGSALASSLCYFFASFARAPRSRKWIFTAARFLFFWLRWMDHAQKTDAAFDAASGVYFLGRRASEAISDAELVASYRGGMGVSGRAAKSKVRGQ